MEVSKAQRKRPLFVGVVAGYLIVVGIIRLASLVLSLVHDHHWFTQSSGPTRGLGLTSLYLISGVGLFGGRRWARSFALGTLAVSTLDLMISARHLISWGAQLYAKGLLIALVLILWNAAMFLMLTRRSAVESFS